MSCTIVVGGQFGSEGKGKVVSLMAAQVHEPWVVRCGGPNSGHTVSVAGSEVVLRQVPAGAGHPRAVLLLGAGCAVDVDILLAEMEKLGLGRERVVVDPRAVLVTEADKAVEADAVIRIASTSSGTGAAMARRMMRSPDVLLAGQCDAIRTRVRVEPVAPLLHAQLTRGGHVIVEGTQGFGLSLLHGSEYPYVTARDTTAAGFASEVGLSPRHINSIVVVIRTFPIRVGGNSGPLPDEVDWETVRRISGAPKVMPEYTSVTHRLRRVAKFDLNAVVTACRYNYPTALAVMGLDRLDYQDTGKRRLADLTAGARQFLRKLEQSTGVPVAWAGTGFGTFDAIHINRATEDQHVHEFA